MYASQEFLSALEGWEPRPALEPDCPHEPMITAEERRLRRMISNRDSARRSRMRKQRHLEDLRCQLDRLKSENRELSNRLRAATQCRLPFLRDNDRLRSESVALSGRLAEIRRALLFRQLQRLASPATAAVCAGFAPGAGGEPNFSSLIV